jgi:hypothetical protein
MSWRSTQLGSNLCDQDRLILNLFGDRPVRYIGTDTEFAANLNCDQFSTALILILNQPLWLSQVVQQCRQHLADPVDTVYIGINRYCVKGNDTTRNFVDTESPGLDLINMLESVITESGYTKTDSGYFDRDLGRYFNFVQPLTWIYGTKNTNSNH